MWCIPDDTSQEYLSFSDESLLPVWAEPGFADRPTAARCALGSLAAECSRLRRRRS
jgi:hypothetical protein